MSNSEANTWAAQLMGPSGPQVRDQLPGVLVATHNKCVALQNASELSSAYPYGLMWVMLPNAVARELGSLPGAEKFRPRNGKYPVLSFNGIPILPWRISKEQVSHLENTALADALTGSKRALFDPRPVQSMFDLSGLDASSPASGESGNDEDPQLQDTISELVGKDTHVALLAYSSNQHALLSAYFGYAKLQENGSVEYSFYEPIDLAGTTLKPLRLVHEAETTDFFDSGDLDGLVLRARNPLEGTPSPERPLDLPSTAEEDNE